MAQSVLIVEDDQGFCRLLEMYLGRNYAVTLAHNSADAAQLIAEHTYNCVLLDVTLPDRSGWDLFPLINQRSPETAKIVMTGLSDDATKERARTLGVHDIVLKPATPMQVKSVLQSVLSP